MHGLRCGRGRRGIEPGIGLFVDDRGSTTVGAAVAILVSLSLVFGAASAQWVASRAADVQAVADAGALAGMNVVSGYVVAAQVLDALVLSMGLVGMLTLAVGIVVSAIPVADAAGPPILSAADSVFRARDGLARTAARGLSVIERAVPYIVSVNSFLAVRANGSGGISYVGLAVPYPQEGSSDFGDLSQDGASQGVRTAIEKGDEVDRLAKEAAAALERAEDARRRGWYADCGGDVSMRERAGTLAGLAGAANPHYPTEVGWDFGVAILRARAYYAQRLADEAPLDSTTAELTRSCARRAFYAYAYEAVCSSSFHPNGDGTCTCDLRELPANTSDVRGTRLYTDSIWYCSTENGRRVIHSSPSCPGATGPAAGTASVADEESGACQECPICRFTVVDIGRAPAASTSIDNGFEHYWREAVRASREYQEELEAAAELENRSREAADGALGGFREALSHIKANRVRLQPPGRYGCMCVVADVESHRSPQILPSALGGTALLPARAAVSAAVLAPDASASNAGVLGDFFDALVVPGTLAGLAGGALDAAVTTWGNLIASYGNGYDAFMDSARSAFTRLSDLGMGRVSEWLKGALEDAIELTSLEPADLRVRKPVLVNTGEVMSRAGNDWYAAARSLVQAIRRVGPQSTPAEIVSAIGVAVESYTGSTVVTVAELEIPGTNVSVPIEIDLAWLAEVGEAA